MADYGLKIKNYDAEIQIDSIYKNYALKQASSTACSGGEDTIDFTDVSDSPIFITKADPTYYHCVHQHAKSGSNYISALVQSGDIFTLNSGYNGGAFTLYWKNFIPGYVNLPTYGLLVKNPSDEIVFSSEDEYLKIINTYTQNVGFSDVFGEVPDTVDVTVSNADDNYFLLTDYSYDERPSDEVESSYNHTARGIKKINSTTIRITGFVWKEVATGTSRNSWYDSCTLIEFGG